MASSEQHINLAGRLGITAAELDVLIKRQVNVDNLESSPPSPSFMRMLTEIFKRLKI